jgi:hypothetical protein
MLDEITNVPPDGEASGPEAAGETPLCSDQETARSERVVIKLTCSYAGHLPKINSF